MGSEKLSVVSQAEVMAAPLFYVTVHLLAAVEQLRLPQTALRVTTTEA